MKLVKNKGGSGTGRNIWIMDMSGSDSLMKDSNLVNLCFRLAS